MLVGCQPDDHVDASIGYVYFFRPCESRFRYTILTKLTQLAGCSRTCHCAFGTAGIVVDMSYINGVRFFDAEDLERFHPSVTDRFAVPLSRAPDLSLWNRYAGVPYRFMPVVRRCLSFNRTEFVYDCVCIVLSCLRMGGVNVPTRIATPGGLWRWCRGRGYPHVERRTST